MDMSKRAAELLLLLNEENYITAEELALQMGVSEKTVRNTVRDLSGQLAGSGVEIQSKSRHGYRLIVTDEKAYQKMAEEAKELQDQRVDIKNPPIPDNSHDRMEYLMARLLYSHDYIKLDDFCDFLYISRSTLSHSLSEVESLFGLYDLSIDRRPNHGIKAEGREFDRRRLIADYFVKRSSSVKDEPEDELAHIADVAEKLLLKYEISLSENEFENFVDYTYVAIHRSGDGFPIERFEGQIPEIGIKEQLFVRELLSELGTERDQVLNEDEQHYLEIYLAGKRMIGNVLENDKNFVIHEQTDRIALKILSVLSSDYHMDLLNNFDLRMTLNQHLAPLDVRMRFNIPLKNPLLADIKRDYPLAYQMGLIAGGVLSDYYKKPVSEDETGYLALILQLVLEKETEKEKYNILIVCSTGKSTSRLLKYRFEQQFGSYLDKLYICDLLGVSRFDFSQVDYVFTTVPITVSVSVPIIEVGSFLMDADIRKISETLRDGDRNLVIRKYFGPRRFLAHFPGDTKDEILSSLCQIIASREKVDDDFYDLVLKRESFAQADVGNAIALPHPNGIASDESFAYCAVTEKPVIWNNSPVQVIILVSMGRNESDDEMRQRFYESVAEFALNGESVKTLIAHPEYEVFEKLTCVSKNTND